MTPTSAQLAVLRARYPNIGELVLRMNAATLLAQPLSKEVIQNDRDSRLHTESRHPTNGAKPLIPSNPASGAASPRPKADRAATATETTQKRKPRASRVPKTRNGGTWTEAQFWGRLRSCLRRMSIYWVPARMALHAARVASKGPRGRKWLFLCAHCQKLFLRRQVELDHKEPVGALTDYAHFGDFIRRLLPESPDAYQVVCTKCHQAKTNRERENK